MFKVKLNPDKQDSLEAQPLPLAMNVVGARPSPVGMRQLYICIVNGRIKTMECDRLDSYINRGLYLIDED